MGKNVRVWFAPGWSRATTALVKQVVSIQQAISTSPYLLLVSLPSTGIMFVALNNMVIVFPFNAKSQYTPTPEIS